MASLLPRLVLSHLPADIDIGTNKRRGDRFRVHPSDMRRRLPSCLQAALDGGGEETVRDPERCVTDLGGDGQVHDVRSHRSARGT